MNVDEQLRKAVTQLYYWQTNYTGSFSNIIFTLFQKADPANLAKLTRGFPEEAEAWKLWQEAGDGGNELFRAYGLLIP